MIETWKDQPGMLGVRRRSIMRGTRIDWNGTAVGSGRRRSGLDIPVMMNAPTVLPEVGEVAKRHPRRGSSSTIAAACAVCGMTR
jgi:hypothetical protein